MSEKLMTAEEVAAYLRLHGADGLPHGEAGQVEIGGSRIHPAFPGDGH